LKAELRIKGETLPKAWITTLRLVYHPQGVRTSPNMGNEPDDVT